MGRPARDSGRGENAGEELLRDAHACEHDGCPEVDVGRVWALWVGLVEDLQGHLFGVRGGLVELRCCGLGHLAEEFRARVVGPVYAMAETREAGVLGVRVA